MLLVKALHLMSHISNIKAWNAGITWEENMSFGLSSVRNSAIGVISHIIRTKNCKSLDYWHYRHVCYFWRNVFVSPERDTVFQRLQWLKPQTCRLAVCSTKFGRGSLWVIVSVLLLKTGAAWKDWQWPFVYWPPAAYSCLRRARHKQCAALKKVYTARGNSVATALLIDLTAEVNIDPKHTVALLCKSSKLSPPLTLSVLWTADNGPIMACGCWVDKDFFISPVSTHYVKVSLERSRVNRVVLAQETRGTSSRNKRAKSVWTSWCLTMRFVSSCAHLLNIYWFHFVW